MRNIPYELRYKIFVFSGFSSNYLEAFNLRHDTIWGMSKIDFSIWTLANETEKNEYLSTEKKSMDLLTLELSKISYE